MGKKTIKIPIAIMGLGKIAIDQHVPSIAASDVFELVATISQHNHLDGVPNFRNLDEAIKAVPQLQAVAICTQPQVRCDITINAIKHGLHVLMEKPPTSTICEYYEVLHAHSASDKTLFTAWHSRYAAKVIQAHEWLKDKKLKAVSITWRESAHKWHPGQQWLWEPGGMGVFDPAINSFSIVTKLLGREIRVIKSDFETPKNQATPIAARLQMKHKDVPITADLDFREEDKEIWEILFETTDGETLKLGRGGASISINGSEYETAQDIEYASAYREFEELIKLGKSNADNSPHRIVADSFLMAKVEVVENFHP